MAIKKLSAVQFPARAQSRKACVSRFALSATVFVLFAICNIGVGAADTVSDALQFVAAKSDSRTTALAIAARMAEQDAVDPSVSPEQIARLLTDIGLDVAQMGDAQISERLFAKAIEIIRTKAGNDSPETVAFAIDLAQKSADRGIAALALAYASEAEARLGQAFVDQPAAYARFSSKLQAIYLQLSRPEAAARLANKQAPVAPKVRGFRPSARTSEQKSGAHLVDVFFATNRSASSDKAGQTEFGGNRGPLKLGIATVSIPANHQVGEIDAPRWYRLEFHRNADDSILMSHVDVFEPSEFFAKLHKRIADSARREAFIYIHGFANSFDDGAMRAAQLAYDLQFDGAPILYSWPSRGNTLAYSQDENELIRPTIDDLQKFLENVVAQSGADHIYLVAHSMGNRFLLEALETMIDRREKAGKQPSPIFDEAVFAAPDVDADQFRSEVGDVRPWIGRMTLYASSKDWALAVSKKVNGAPRAGDAASLLLFDGISSIDATAMQSDWLGHAYFADGAIGDLRALLLDHLSPDRRCPLEPRDQGRAPYWVFSVSRCNTSSFGLAALLLEQLGPQKAYEALRDDLLHATDSAKPLFADALTILNAMTR